MLQPSIKENFQPPPIPNRLYKGIGLLHDGRARLKIAVVDYDNNREYDLIGSDTLEFSCGYAGQGPFNTARSILTDLLGPDDAERYYEVFKRAFIAQHQLRIGRCFILTSRGILTWLEVIKRQNAGGAPLDN